MTDSDSLRGDIDRPHPNLPQCCGELEILRALLRPRMAEAGDPTPTEALRGMFIEIERLRATTSEGARCQALEVQYDPTDEEDEFLLDRADELLQLSMDGASDRDIFERIESLKAKLAEERKRTNILAEEATAEGRLSRAAADGHDHARALLVAIAEVFGRVDDLDSLPAKVRELSDNCLHNCTKAERLQDRVDEQDKARVLRAAETASERNHLEGELTRAKAEIKSLTHATFTIHQLTTAIGNAAKEVGVLCEGRSALDILPDLLANMSHKTAFAAEYATERVQAHIEHAKNRVAEAEAALALLGWDRAQDMTTFQRGREDTEAKYKDAIRDWSQKYDAVVVERDTAKAVNDTLNHALKSYDRQLRDAHLANQHLREGRYAESRAFSETLSAGFDFLDWSPSDPSSPIAILRELLVEIRKRAGADLSP